MKHGIPCHKEKNKYDEAKHEEDPGEGHEEVLWREVTSFSFGNVSFI